MRYNYNIPMIVLWRLTIIADDLNPTTHYTVTCFSTTILIAISLTKTAIMSIISCGFYQLLSSCWSIAGICVPCLLIEQAPQNIITSSTIYTTCM